MVKMADSCNASSTTDQSRYSVVDLSLLFCSSRVCFPILNSSFRLEQDSSLQDYTYVECSLMLQLNKL